MCSCIYNVVCPCRCTLFFSLLFCSLIRVTSTWSLAIKSTSPGKAQFISHSFKHSTSFLYQIQWCNLELMWKTLPFPVKGKSHSTLPVCIIILLPHQAGASSRNLNTIFSSRKGGQALKELAALVWGMAMPKYFVQFLLFKLLLSSPPAKMAGGWPWFVFFQSLSSMSTEGGFAHCHQTGQQRGQAVSTRERGDLALHREKAASHRFGALI